MYLNSKKKLNKIVLLAPVATVQPISPVFMIRSIISMIPFDYFFKNLMYWTIEDLVKKDKKRAENRVNELLMSSKSFKSKPRVIPTVLDDNELKSVKIPVLYLVGENEKIYSAKKAIKRLNNVAPHIKTEMIPNAGRDLPIVQAEIVNKKVLEFLGQYYRLIYVS